MLSTTKKLVWIIGAFCAIPICLFLLFVYAISRPPLDRQIAGSITLSSEWLEITVEPPLKPSRQIQYIVVNCEVGTSDTEPEAQLVGSDGNAYKLDSLVWMDIGIGLTAYDHLPQDRVYNTVRLRSNKPMQCSRIRWYCYDMK